MIFNRQDGLLSSPIFDISKWLQSDMPIGNTDFLGNGLLCGYDKRNKKADTEIHKRQVKEEYT